MATASLKLPQRLASLPAFHIQPLPAVRVTSRMVLLHDGEKKLSSRPNPTRVRRVVAEWRKRRISRQERLHATGKIRARCLEIEIEVVAWGNEAEQLSVRRGDRPCEVVGTETGTRLVLTEVFRFC
jgi:hypothetical protein